MSSSRRNWLVLVGLAAAVLAADQLSKNIVIRALQVGESLPVLPPVFAITRSENTGSAFGFLPNSGDLFLILAIIIVAGLLLFYRRIPPHARLMRIGVALVCGGALGNAVDRVVHGAVIDFIHYTLPGVISNISNLADHAIVLGVVLIVIESWRSDAPKPPPENGERPAEERI